jgi:GNAT superfamily N-acetyltransferase
MLYYAAHMDESGESPESARNNPDLASYVAGWSSADLGIIAHDPAADRDVGAAWIRVMPAGNPLHRFVAQHTPEMAIAVAPEYVGSGAGTLLLDELMRAAASDYRQIVLSVRADNPARRLYERLGFAKIGELTNRVGTRSWVMTAAPGASIDSVKRSPEA